MLSVCKVRDREAVKPRLWGTAPLRMDVIGHYRKKRQEITIPLNTITVAGGSKVALAVGLGGQQAKQCEEHIRMMHQHMHAERDEVSGFLLHWHHDIMLLTAHTTDLVMMSEYLWMRP